MRERPGRCVAPERTERRADHNPGERCEHGNGHSTVGFSGTVRESHMRKNSLIMDCMARNTAHAYGPSALTVKGRYIRLRTIGFVLLAGLTIWFIAANTKSVTIRLWIPTVTLPLWSVLTVTLLVGMALGLLVARRRAHR